MYGEICSLVSGSREYVQLIGRPHRPRHAANYSSYFSTNFEPLGLRGKEEEETMSDVSSGDMM